MLGRVKSSWSLAKDRLNARNVTSQHGENRASTGRLEYPASTAATSCTSSALEENNQTLNNRRHLGLTTTEICEEPQEQNDLAEQGLLEGIEEVTDIEEAAAASTDSNNLYLRNYVAHKASCESTGTVVRHFIPSVPGPDLQKSSATNITPSLPAHDLINTLKIETSNEDWKQTLTQGARILDAAAGGCEDQLRNVDGLTAEGNRCSRILGRLSFDLDRLVERKEEQRKRDAEAAAKPLKTGLRIRQSMSILKRPSTWFRK